MEQVYDSVAKSLAKRVIAAVKKNPKDVNYTYSGGIIVKKQKTIPFTEVIAVDIHRDFLTSYSDMITIEVLVNTREFYSVILNNLNGLEVFIKRRQVYEESPEIVRGGLSDMVKYKAFVIDPPKRGLGGDVDGGRLSDVDLSITKTHLQLIPLDVMEIKGKKWSGILPNTNPLDALSMILDGSSDDIDYKGLQRVEVDNKKTRQIIIPQGTSVKDMAWYIQSNYGIYNFGIGSYYFDDHWFIYPLFDNDRYNKEKYKLSISVLDRNENLSRDPRTYTVNEGNLIIVTRAEGSIVDKGNANQLNSGTGFAVIRPEQNLATNMKTVGTNKVQIDAKESMEVTSVVQRDDGYNDVKLITTQSCNQEKLISEFVGNTGYYIDITWEHANPKLLIPAMPVKITFLSDGVKNIYGTLHEYHAVAVPVGQFIGVKPYQCNVMMRIYVTGQPEVKL